MCYIVENATNQHDLAPDNCIAKQLCVVGLLRNQYRAAQMLIWCLKNRKPCLKFINSLPVGSWPWGTNIRQPLALASKQGSFFLTESCLLCLESLACQTSWHTSQGFPSVSHCCMMNFLSPLYPNTSFTFLSYCFSQWTGVCQHGRDRDRDVNWDAGLSYSLGDWEETHRQTEKITHKGGASLRLSQTMQTHANILQMVFLVNAKLWGLYESISTGNSWPVS